MHSVQFGKWMIVGAAIILCGLLMIAFSCTSDKDPEGFPDRNTSESSLTGPLLDPESEERMVTAAIEENADNPVALASIGDEYFETKRYSMAARVYEKVLELHPDVDTYNDLGLALLYTGRPDEAIMKLREGAELDPSYQRIWLSLGFVYMSVEKPEEARNSLEKAVELDPKSGIAEEARKFISILDRLKK